MVEMKVQAHFASFLNVKYRCPLGHNPQQTDCIGVKSKMDKFGAPPKGIQLPF
jgi:hypothetical protein